MGTKNTAVYKHRVVKGYLEKAKEQGVNVDREKLISTIMVECLCERRKALEIIKAHIEYYGYTAKKIDERWVYVLNA